MFQLGRELKRIFRPQDGLATPKDGVAGRDPAALELLNLDMLRAEAKAADVAAGRISARDRPSLHLRQAQVWSELARRTGEAVALRKAASAAEIALDGVDRRHRAELWAAIRLQQAQCALLGAELFGDEGLAAAADHALAEAAAAAPKSTTGAVARVFRARIAGAAALLRGDVAAAIDAAASCNPAIRMLDAGGRDRCGRRAAALARLVRAELLCACGVRASDERILESGLSDAVRACAILDPGYDPVSWSRAATQRGEILTAIGEITGDAAPLSRAIEVLTPIFDLLLRDHSAVDWARAQLRLGQALAAMGEATGDTLHFDKARNAFERAVLVLQREPGLALRAAAAQGRASVIAAEAEATGDLMSLDEAEAAFRCELAAIDATSDPVAWAVIQVNLAQIYQARRNLTGRDRGERAKAALALDMALEVFSEHGLRSLSALAQSGLERLRATV